jgi:hypothetical protein
LRINYKMLSLSLVIVAILVALFTSIVLAAPGDQNVTGNGKGVGYGAQNCSGQQSCQGQCDGQCDGECDKGEGECSGECKSNGINGCQGSANRGNG